jgi:hypothetical protein
MTPTTEARKVMPVPARAETFEHLTVILRPIHGRWDCPHLQPFISRCVTRRPAARCECFMYALAWEPRPRP